MIAVPTHKCRKISFIHSKTIYVFTSGRVITTVQIHSREKLLKEFKWPLQNGPLKQQDLHYPAARFNEKGCLLVWGEDALKSMHIAQFGKSFLEEFSTPTSKENLASAK